MNARCFFLVPFFPLVVKPLSILFFFFLLCDYEFAPASMQQAQQFIFSIDPFLFGPYPAHIPSGNSNLHPVVGRDYCLPEARRTLVPIAPGGDGRGGF